jgi:hypothetical protein
VTQAGGGGGLTAPGSGKASFFASTNGISAGQGDFDANVGIGSPIADTPQPDAPTLSTGDPMARQDQAPRKADPPNQDDPATVATVEPLIQDDPSMIGKGDPPAQDEPPAPTGVDATSRRDPPTSVAQHRSAMSEPTESSTPDHPPGEDPSAAATAVAERIGLRT